MLWQWPEKCSILIVPFCFGRSVEPCVETVSKSPTDMEEEKKESSVPLDVANPTIVAAGEEQEERGLQLKKRKRRSKCRKLVPGRVAAESKNDSEVKCFSKESTSYNDCKTLANGVDRAAGPSAPAAGEKEKPSTSSGTHAPTIFYLQECIRNIRNRRAEGGATLTEEERLNLLSLEFDLVCEYFYEHINETKKLFDRVHDVQHGVLMQLRCFQFDLLTHARSSVLFKRK